MPPYIDRRPSNGQVSGNGKVLSIDHYRFKPVGSLNGNGEVLPRTDSEVRRERIWHNLGALYPDKTPAERAAIQREIYETIARRRVEYLAEGFPQQPVNFTQKDVNIITYPDSVYRKGDNEYGYDGATMDAFESLFTGQDLDSNAEKLDNVFNGIQLLPHQLASHLDRGFSQKDPYTVYPKFGSWDNVKRLAKSGVRVTVDQLVNHMSIEGEWFQRGEMQGDPEFQNLFESYPENDPPHEKFIDNFKPREHSNWTLINTARGPRWYRTTFGDKGTTDQVDLDYHNPNVLLKQLDISLFNVANGAGGIRMDSMAFTWKEPGEGNRGIHEPQVKNLLQIFRDVVDEVNPGVRLLSENNVPQKQNIEYLGEKGEPLSQIVYDFGEAAMGYHALATGQVDDLTTWMLQQPQLPDGTSKINHVSCHDGVFLQEVYSYFREKDRMAFIRKNNREPLPEEESPEWGKADMQKLFEWVLDHGGELAMRKSPKGEVAVYELDSTVRSLVSKEDEPPELARRKHLLLYATAWAIQGIPAVFLPSLVGKRNDRQKFDDTGMPRDLLRVDMDYDELVAALNNKDSEERKTYDAMIELLKKRISHPAFSPTAPQEILTRDKAVETVNGTEDMTKQRVFGVRRMSAQGDMVALHNFSGDTVNVTYEGNEYTLEPYEYIWEEVPARSGNGKVFDLFQARQFQPAAA